MRGNTCLEMFPFEIPGPSREYLNYPFSHLKLYEIPLCRKTKKSKDQLINDQEMQANQDLLNLALETDPFLLQQQQVEQQMYLLGMQQPQDQYMPYFDASAMQGKKGLG